jgi:regulatory protein
VKNKDASPLQKAKNYAFLLLKFRPRSEKEIILRLKRKKFQDQIIKEAVSFLKEKNFIDDQSFARAWVQSRIRRPLGLRRISQELKIKGISQETIDKQIAAAKESYCEESIVAKIAKDRFSKLKTIEPDKARRRIFDYLLRRGFSPDIVRDTLSAKAKGVPME